MHGKVGKDGRQRRNYHLTGSELQSEAVRLNKSVRANPVYAVKILKNS